MPTIQYTSLSIGHKRNTFSCFFSIRIFFYRNWWFTGQQGKGGDHRLFRSTTSTCSQTFRYLFATLHVRWLSRIFNRSACVYQTATRWDLPPYRITIWLIDLWCELTNQVCYFYIRKNIFSCLFSIHNTINLSHREQVCLTRLRFEGYFSHHPIIHDFNIKKIVYW